MVYLIILIGMFLGFIFFTFTFIASKKNGKYYLAPIITFLMAIGITAYGIFFIGGFEGMGYGLLATGFLFISIIGTLLLPLFIRKKSSQQFKKGDKISLFILPIVFFLTIGLIIYSDKGYWIIEQGETSGEKEGYRISTILEGRKEVLLILGEEYLGKEIVVKKVSRRGPTKITVEIVEGNNKNKAPFIKIGLDEINEPLKVQTTDGVIFNSIMVK
ncbi:YesK family protein [Solibacillus sp. CAU 1738]|uniref:YesK family protein n=1 Tax=Solibacillus sp. CAU 1738 TaxID=3140363 RepID=UPI003261953E